MKALIVQRNALHLQKRQKVVMIQCLQLHDSLISVQDGAPYGGMLGVFPVC